MSSFQDILNMPVSDFNEPPPFPPGTYRAMMLKHELITAKTGTGGIALSCKILQPMQDVDTTKLPEGWNEREMTIRFYITRDSAWRWREFLEKHLGINVSGRPTSQILPDIPGKTCLVTVKQEIAKKGNVPDPSGRMVSFIDGTAAEH